MTGTMAVLGAGESYTFDTTWFPSRLSGDFTTVNGGTATLCFDAETGLLVRLVRFSNSPVGRVVTRIDYSDYREVAGVKMPFKWTVS